MAEIFQAGIDVSRYQGTVDWAQVAASGKQFAILRVASSNDAGVYIDPTFEQNYIGARAAGLRVGAYYYTYARTDAYADLELAAVAGALAGKQLEYPVFADFEAQSLIPLGRAALTRMALRALESLRAAGWYSGLYTYSYFAQHYLDMSVLAAFPFFVADYTGSVTYPGAYQMWQYSGTGRVPGIVPDVDLDESYEDFLPALRAGGWNGYAPAAQQPEMFPLPGLQLEVYGLKNCQYFYGPDVNAVAGTLPPGVYEAVAQSLACWNGYPWATVRCNGGVYWTALIPDRCFLLRL